MKEALGNNWTTWANSVDLTETTYEVYTSASLASWSYVDEITSSTTSGLTSQLRSSNAITDDVNVLNNVRFNVGKATTAKYTVDTQYYIKVTFYNGETTPAYINHIVVPVMFTAPTVADQFALKPGYVVDGKVNAFYYDNESAALADRKSVQLNRYFDNVDEEANITLDTQTTLATLSDGTALKSAHLAVLADQVVTSGEITTYSKIDGDIYLNTTYGMGDGTNRELGYGKELVVNATNETYDGWYYKTAAQKAYSFTIKVMSPIYEGTIRPVDASTIKVIGNLETGFAITKSMIELADYNKNLYSVVPDKAGTPNNENGGADVWSADQINDVWVTTDANNTYIKELAMRAHEVNADGEVTQEGAIIVKANPLPNSQETSMTVNVKDCWGYLKAQEVSVTIVKQ